MGCRVHGAQDTQYVLYTSKNTGLTKKSALFTIFFAVYEFVRIELITATNNT